MEADKLQWRWQLHWRLPLQLQYRSAEGDFRVAEGCSKGALNVHVMVAPQMKSAKDERLKLRYRIVSQSKKGQ